MSAPFAMLHGITITNPIALSTISNYYMVPTRLFVLGNKELKFPDRTIQGVSNVVNNTLLFCLNDLWM